MLTGKERANVVNKRSEKTDQVVAKCKENVSHSISVGNEIVAQEAKGAIIEDVEGNTYIDFFGGVGVLNAGHRPEPVVAAIKEQLDKYIHTFFHQVMSEPYVDLAEKINEIAPIDGPAKSAFFNSGAEAVENAVKVARACTKRQGIVAFDGAFHGRTLLTMTLTSKVKPYRFNFGPYAPEIYKIAPAYCYRCAYNMTYPACGMYCLEKFHKFFKSEVDPEHIAAMIIEPVQGEGGFVVPPKEFLPGLADICKENGILFIADEVQTGFGRTGKMFACENFGVKPDLMTFAKSIAAGMPLSGLVGKAEYMDSPAPGQLGGTYGGNPVSLASGIATLKFFEDNQLCDAANKIGAYSMKRLAAIEEKYPEVGEIRALGAMIGIELVKDKVSKEPNSEATSAIIKACAAKGLIIISAGVYGNVIRMLAPLVITDEQLAQALDILEESFEEVLD